MKISKTFIEDLLIIEPQLFKDDRGFFYESYNKNNLDKVVNVIFVQDNESKSNEGVIRGLHFQKPPYGQSKLVSVIKGSVLDVVVDIRKNSNTYGQYVMEELTEFNHHQLYIPVGMAHGFLALEDHTIFSYKCSNFYHKESEDSLLWNDKDLNINWPNINPILSEKDKNAKKFSSFVSPFQ